MLSGGRALLFLKSTRGTLRVSGFFSNLHAQAMDRPSLRTTAKKSCGAKAKKIRDNYCCRTIKQATMKFSIALGALLAVSGSAFSPAFVPRNVVAKTSPPSALQMT
jgi:hypothetical protein